MAEGSEPDREAALRLAMLRHWHGDQLSAEQWHEVSRQTPHRGGGGLADPSPRWRSTTPTSLRSLFTPYRPDERPGPAVPGAALGTTGLPAEVCHEPTRLQTAFARGRR